MFRSLLFLAFVSPAFSSMTTEAFKKHEVVSDVIPTAPEKLIKVSFKSGVEVRTPMAKKVLHAFRLTSETFSLRAR